MTDRWALAECFGKNMARWKSQRGMSLEQIAERAGIHRTHVSMLIRGKRVVRIDTAIKVAHALEVPVEALFDGIEWDGRDFVPARSSES